MSNVQTAKAECRWVAVIEMDETRFIEYAASPALAICKAVLGAAEAGR